MPYAFEVLRSLVLRLWREVAAFGIVGLINFGVDVGLFNLLRHTAFDDKPLTAKVLSTSVAATSSYFMNRHWTWRDRNRSGLSRELPLFLLLSAIGLGISTGCLAISHYALGFTSVLADNVSANGVGLVLGMLWRFWSFKKWVFLAPPESAEPSALEDAVRTTA